MLRKLALSLTVAGAVVLTSLPVMVVTSTDAEAKGFRSSSSFSRGSFRSSSSSGWGSSSKSRSSKPSGSFWGSSKKSTKTASTGGSKSFKSSDGKTGSIKTAPRKATIAQQKQAKRTKAVLAQKRQQSKFKKPAAPIPGVKATNGKPSRVATNAAYRDTYKSNPVYTRAARNDSSTYWDRRTNYYNGYDAPRYVYDSSPSFGMWDAVFLSYMLNSSSNAGQFAHHQQNDPGYQMWRSEMNDLAKDNADLRTRLAAMDAEAAKLAGSPIDAGYLPKGVDADIALASDVRQSTLPEVRFCTGGRDGAYFLTVAGVIAPAMDYVNMIPVETEGATQNIEYIEQGKCDMAYIQGDLYWNYVEDHQTANLPFSLVMSPYRESVHLFCHEDGPDEISDFDDDIKVWFPNGAGSAGTWRNFMGEEEDYAEVQTVLVNGSMKTEMTGKDNAYALMKVKNDKNSCMMYVAAAGATEFLKSANAGAVANKIVLVDIDDGALDNTEDPSGRDVYDFTQFDEELYGNLTRQAGAVYGAGDVDTLTVAADIIVSDKWKTANAAIYPKVEMQMTGLTDRIKAVVAPVNR